MSFLEPAVRGRRGVFLETAILDHSRSKLYLDAALLDTSLAVALEQLGPK